MTKIRSIEITKSLFFKDGFKLVFNDKLNCIMGGRGTGKSTLLHFIKACLEKEAEEDKDTFSILRNNLDSGTITLHLVTNDGKNIKIQKTLGEEPQTYLLSPTEHYIPFDNVINEIRCDIFPALKIEDIGKNSFERLRLIDSMVIEDINILNGKIQSCQIELEKNAKDIRKINLDIKYKEERLKDFATIEEELATHKTTQPPDIKERENKEFELQDAAEKTRGAEERYLKKLLEIFSLHLEQYDGLIDEIERTRTILVNTESFLNKDIIDPLSRELNDAIIRIQKSNKASAVTISEVIGKVKGGMVKLSELHNLQHNEFVKLKQKLEKHKVFYDKLNILTKKYDTKKVLMSEIKEFQERKTKIKVHRDKLVSDLNQTKNEIYSIRMGKIKTLNKMFEKGRVKITLTPGGITDEYEDALRNALKGHNMRYNIIIPYIVENFSPDKLADVIHRADTEKLKEISGIDNQRSQDVMDALFETDNIYQIESLYCPDLPDFFLKIDKEEEHVSKSADLYKKSDELSTGQRCTTVLPIVFSISNNPLLIDQPEDNLDNKYISESIHEIIKQQKDERQLIFITHNPNIPVLPDSEYNVFLKYENKIADILAIGSVKDVKEEILRLLEGGEKAFETRNSLYHQKY